MEICDRIYTPDECGICKILPVEFVLKVFRHSDDSGGLLKVREVKSQNIEILIFYCFYQ